MNNSALNNPMIFVRHVTNKTKIFKVRVPKNLVDTRERRTCRSTYEVGSSSRRDATQKKHKPFESSLSLDYRACNDLVIYIAESPIPEWKPYLKLAPIAKILTISKKSQTIGS